MPRYHRCSQPFCSLPPFDFRDCPDEDRFGLVLATASSGSSLELAGFEDCVCGVPARVLAPGETPAGPEVAIALLMTPAAVRIASTSPAILPIPRSRLLA